MPVDVSKTLRQALSRLIVERQRIDRQISAIEAALDGFGGRGRGRPLAAARPGRQAAKPGRARRRMGAAARKAVSQRMKAYWAKRRARSGKKATLGKKKRTSAAKE